MIEITVNGEKTSLPQEISTSAFLRSLGFDTRKVAIERNREIVAKSRYNDTMIQNGDELEIVHFIGGGDVQKVQDGWEIAGKNYYSRLIVGTGKYKDFEETKRAVEASGAARSGASSIRRLAGPLRPCSPAG